MRKTHHPLLFNGLFRISQLRLLIFQTFAFPFQNYLFLSTPKSPKVSFSAPHSISHSLIYSNTFCSSLSSTSSSKLQSFSEKPRWNSSGITPKPWIGIGKSVISKCSHLWNRKVEIFDDNYSLQDILKEYGDLSPDTARRFWRVSTLRPSDFLEILMGFGPDVENSRKVQFLLSLFRWAIKKNRGFCHLPLSYEIMASLLIRARMFQDAESLLLSAEGRGVFSSKTVSEIISGYAKDFRLESSIALYENARNHGLVPMASCYLSLLNLLISMEKAELVLRVYMDMIEVGLGSSSDNHIVEFVGRSLCNNGRILEAVDMLRRIRNVGVEPSVIALNLIIEGYCSKRDYEDVFNFLNEWKHIPEASVCNRMVSSLCKDFGSEEAWLFVQRLKDLGFELNAITFEMLISWCCRERKLRDAFIYLSEGFSGNVKPRVHTYTALISGVFKAGIHKCANDIFEEIDEKGLMPGLSTCKVLLAGYCKFRKFDEAKKVLCKMINYGMISVAPMEDALSKAFMVLGLDHLRVKVKRDNELGLSKAEFFDSLGNGLYLDTDLEEYDKILEGILDNAFIPNFDSLVIEKCRKGDIESALKVKDEAIQWGESLCLSTYSKLLKRLSVSTFHLKEAVICLREMLDKWDELDHKTLNLLVRNLSRNGMVVNARLILDRLLKRELPVESDTYTALIFGFGKEKNAVGLRDCLQLAQRGTWLPDPSDIKSLVRFLCKERMLKEVLELFESMMDKYLNPDSTSDVCNTIVKELSAIGFTSVGLVLVKEILQRDLAVDYAAYRNLIEGFSKEKKFTETLEIIDMLLAKNIVPCENIYQLSVPLLFRMNKVAKAMDLKQSMLNKQLKPSVLLYNALVNELCRIGKLKEVAFQLQEMKANEVLPDSTTLNALLRSYCGDNNFRKTLEVLCIILRKEAGLSISGYRSLIRQLCSNGQIICALNIKELMHVESESQLLILYNILVFSLFRTGNYLPVEALLKDMQEKHLVFDRHTYDFLVYGFFKCGNVSKAVEALNNMIIKGLRPRNYSLKIVICYLCSRGWINEALELSKVMQLKGWKHCSVIQYAIASGLFTCGGIPQAELFLDEMEEKNMIPDNINYDLLIKKLCMHGRTDRAVRLLDVMLKKGNLPSETSYCTVIRELCIRKAFDQALDFYYEMLHKNLEPNLDISDALVCGLCDSGRPDDARQILRQMLRYGLIPSHSMYNYVINRYHADRNLDKASELLQGMQRAGHSPTFETHWSLISNLSTGDNKDSDDDGQRTAVYSPFWEWHFGKER